MNGRIRTFEDAFQAGWDAPCEHGIADPNDCPGCQLAPEESVVLAALLGPSLRASRAQAAGKSAA